MPNKVFTTTIKQLWEQKVSIIAPNKKAAQQLLESGDYDTHDDSQYITDMNLKTAELLEEENGI